MDEQLDFVKLIASRLESAGIDYMLTGSMALMLYAVPRMTRDVDVVVEADVAAVDTIVGLFRGDCYIEAGSVREATRRKGMFNIIHNESFMKADFIVKKNDEYSREAFARRQSLDLGGTPVWVISAEDLVLSKLAWGKESQSEFQLRDIRQVIAGVSTLDWNYIRTWSAVLDVDAYLQRAMNHE